MIRHTWHGGMGRHAPGPMREAFCLLIDEFNTGELLNLDQSLSGAIQEAFVGYDTFPGEKKATVRWLLGQLWNVSDIMPGDGCSDLDMAAGSTYAQGARKMKVELG